MSLLTKFKDKVFGDKDGDIEQGLELNDQTKKRNGLLSIIAAGGALALVMAIYNMTSRSPSTQAVDTNGAKTSNPFESVVDNEFTEADNNSALTTQQGQIAKLSANMEQLQKQMTDFVAKQERYAADQSEKQEKFQASVEKDVERIRKAKVDEAKKVAKEVAEKAIPDSNEVFEKSPNDNSARTIIGEDVPLGQRVTPPRPSTNLSDSVNNRNISEFTYKQEATNTFNNGIDSFSFVWDEDETEAERKNTIHNYVPTGTFVTAIVTGGADVDGGALGQSNTAPMVFQTVNDGILPNGEHSRLNNCTITGSAYGEISSSRGIVRTNRLSCIFDDDEIVDVSVKGTVFNFGRNGIRGTVILKNGEIVTMAGVAGILDGVGKTGAQLANTTSTSALGSTSTLNSDDAVVSLLGNAGSSVGEKLADYYIQLAELYHPIVELNPGNMVNIVFLEGFPLDSVGIAQYEARQLQENTPVTGSNLMLDVITNNPLSQELSQATNSGTPKTVHGKQRPVFSQ